MGSRAGGWVLLSYAVYVCALLGCPAPGSMQGKDAVLPLLSEWEDKWQTIMPRGEEVKPRRVTGEEELPKPYVVAWVGNGSLVALCGFGFGAGGNGLHWIGGLAEGDTPAVQRLGAVYSFRCLLLTREACLLMGFLASDDRGIKRVDRATANGIEQLQEWEQLPPQLRRLDLGEPVGVDSMAYRGPVRIQDGLGMTRAELVLPPGTFACVTRMYGFLANGNPSYDVALAVTNDDQAAAGISMPETYLLVYQVREGDGQPLTPFAEVRRGRPLFGDAGGVLPGAKQSVRVDHGCLVGQSRSILYRQVRRCAVGQEKLVTAELWLAHREEQMLLDWIAWYRGPGGHKYRFEPADGEAMREVPEMGGAGEAWQEMVPALSSDASRVAYSVGNGVSICVLPDTTGGL